jgi:hypothetical protein
MAERKYNKDNKARYDNQYHREKMLSISIRLHRESDAELIEKYRRIPDKAAWFRKMLREHTE